jgi:hypothetical protein
VFLPCLFFAVCGCLPLLDAKSGMQGYAYSSSSDYESVRLCRSSAPNKMTPASKNELCDGANSVNYRFIAKCAQKAITKMSADFVTKLCRFASERGFPGQCTVNLKGIGKILSEQDAVDLCSHAASVAPAECFNAVTAKQSRLKNTPAFAPLVVELCKHAEGKEQQICAQKASRNMKLAEVVALCTQGGDPIPCYNIAKKNRHLQGQSAIELCAGAISIFPATCAKKAPNKVNLELLCRDATTEAPADCARELERKKRSMSAEDIVSVCAGAHTLGPAECVLELPSNMNSVNKVSLCKHSTSTAPANCFKHSINSRVVKQQKGRAVGDKKQIAIDAVIALCKGATSISPGKL